MAPLHARSPLFILQTPCPNLQVPVNHLSQRFLYVSDLPRTLNGRADIILVEARRLAKNVEILVKIVFVALLTLCEFLDERLRQLSDVEPLVQSLSDAVDAGKRPKDEGERGGEFENAVFR